MKSSYRTHTGYRSGYSRPRGPRQGLQHERTAEQLKASVNWQSFYTSELGPLSGHGEWRTARCPFHDDHRPSLRVNVKHGGYWCPACNAKGDAFRFLKERHGLSFVEALARLVGFA